MIPIKTADQIKVMREGGARLAAIAVELLKEIKVGVRLDEMDQLATKLIKKQAGQASFKMVKDYRWPTCLNINEGVVHGIPNDYQVKAGDLVSLDIGFFYKGFHTDMAWTILVGGSKQEAEKEKKLMFLRAGKEALKKALGIIRPGRRVGHISLAIEEEIKKFGFSSVKSLTGHGVGEELHEEPVIPCFLKGEVKETALLQSGMTLAVEVIYTQGKPDLVLDKDGWTLKTADRGWAGLFEETVVINKKGVEVLTQSKNLGLD